jgi:hypothetical protein
LSSTATAPPTCSPVPTPGALRSSSVHRSPLAPPAPWSTVVKEDVVSGPPPSKPRDREARPVHRRTCWCRDSGVPESIWDEHEPSARLCGDWGLASVSFVLLREFAGSSSKKFVDWTLPAPKQCSGPPQIMFRHLPHAAPLLQDRRVVRSRRSRKELGSRPPRACAHGRCNLHARGTKAAVSAGPHLQDAVSCNVQM